MNYLKRAVKWLLSSMGAIARDGGSAKKLTALLLMTLYTMIMLLYMRALWYSVKVLATTTLVTENWATRNFIELSITMFLMALSILGISTWQETFLMIKGFGDKKPENPAPAAPSPPGPAGAPIATVIQTQTDVYPQPVPTQHTTGQ